AFQPDVQFSLHRTRFFRQFQGIDQVIMISVSDNPVHTFSSRTRLWPDSFAACGGPVSDFFEFVLDLFRSLTNNIDKTPEALAAGVHVRQFLPAHDYTSVSTLSQDGQNYVGALDILGTPDRCFLARAVDSWSVEEVNVSVF